MGSIPLSKPCSKCGTEKPLSEFHAYKKSPDGRKAICKACRKSESLAHYWTNPEKQREKNREKRLKDPEKWREYSRKMHAKLSKRKPPVVRASEGKSCTGCGETKPLSEFWKQPVARDGLAYRCKQCEKEKYIGLYLAPAEKGCACCGRTKGVDCFGIDRRRKDGLNPYCKDCKSEKGKQYNASERGKERMREYYEENKEKIFATQKVYAARHPDRVRQYKAKNYQEKMSRDVPRPAEGIKLCPRCGQEKDVLCFTGNKRNLDGLSIWCRDCLNAYGSDRRERNPEVREKVKRISKLWAEANPERRSQHRSNRRARLAQAEGAFTAEEFKSVCEQYENKCLCCGEAKKLTPDHVIPLSKGGSNWINNIQPLCLPCNLKKGTKTTDYRLLWCRV